MNAMKEVMSNFEERSNNQKEERLDFYTEESESTRKLSSWVGTEEDMKMRMRRAGGLRAKVKEQQKNTRLSKMCQAKILQVCRICYCSTVKREYCGRSERGTAPSYCTQLGPSCAYERLWDGDEAEADGRER